LTENSRPKYKIWSKEYLIAILGEFKSKIGILSIHISSVRNSQLSVSKVQFSAQCQKCLTHDAVENYSSQNVVLVVTRDVVAGRVKERQLPTLSENWLQTFFLSEKFRGEMQHLKQKKPYREKISWQN